MAKNWEKPKEVFYNILKNNRFDKNPRMMLKNLMLAERVTKSTLQDAPLKNFESMKNQSKIETSFKRFQRQ